MRPQNALCLGGLRIIYEPSITTVHVSKVVVNRNKPHLDDLISQNDPGEKDHGQYTYGTLASIRISCQFGPPRCAFKVDTRKAFDLFDYNAAGILVPSGNY